MSEQGPEQRMPTEEELRAAYEKLQVADVVVQTVVSLINLGGMKAGQGDWEQVGKAVDAARALVPLAEEELGPDLAAVRDALSQLQMAFAQQTGAGGQAPSEPEKPEPPSSSGRLWVPGQ